MKWLFKFLANLFGFNFKSTPKGVIVDQLGESRPLPLGVTEFEEWSDRLISGALIPGVHVESQKATLANMLLHLGPTESHKPDAFFIHGLRKLAVNQVAHAMFEGYREKTKTRLAAVETMTNGKDV